MAHLRSETLRNNKVIQAPTNVLGPAIAHVRPIGVAVSFVWVLLAVDVYEAFLEEVTKTVSLFRSESCVPFLSPFLLVR